jgi:hypothetical protein
LARLAPPRPLQKRFRKTFLLTGTPRLTSVTIKRYATYLRLNGRISSSTRRRSLRTNKAASVSYEDFDVKAAGTVNLLVAARDFCPANRIGDHICYISDLTKIRAHFQNWRQEYRIRRIMEGSFSVMQCSRTTETSGAFDRICSR